MVHSYDPEGFSVWRVDFKYNEELTQTFMSSNQIGGFFNRLEASRKYLFGSVGVLGTANDSVISGALILRGADVKPVVDVAPDWESYEYKKLDLSNPEDKAFFEAALAWDLELDGKKWVDGKNVRNSPYFCCRLSADNYVLCSSNRCISVLFAVCCICPLLYLLLLLSRYISLLRGRVVLLQYTRNEKQCESMSDLAVPVASV